MSIVRSKTPSPPLLTDKQKSINLFCELVAHRDTTREAVEKFLSETNIDINVDTHSVSEELPVYLAAHSGNRNVLQYLIEAREANLDARDRDNNLFYYAQQNPSEDVRKYVADPHKKLWEKFRDTTSDLHAAVLGERVEELTQILTENPNRIIEENQKNQSCFAVAQHVGKTKIFATLIAFGLNYIHECKTKKAWENIAIYYHHLADCYKSLSLDTELIQESYETSIHYYQKAITQTKTAGNSNATLLSLYVHLADCQLKYANENLAQGYQQYESMEWRSASNLFDMSEIYLDAAIETQKNLPHLPYTKQTILHLQSERISAIICHASAHFELGKEQKNPRKKLDEYRISIRLITPCIDILNSMNADESHADDFDPKANINLADDCHRQLAIYHHACGVAHQEIGSNAAKSAVTSEHFIKAINAGFQKAIRNIEAAREHLAKISVRGEYEQHLHDSLLRLLAVNQYHTTIAHLNNIETSQSPADAQQHFLLSYRYLSESINIAIDTYETIVTKTPSDAKNNELYLQIRARIEKKKQPPQELSNPIAAEEKGQGIPYSSSPEAQVFLTQTSSNLYQPLRARTPTHLTPLNIVVTAPNLDNAEQKQPTGPSTV
jgi:hypothetical protein